MLRAREIVGLPMLDIHTGNHVGWVQDVVFDEKTDQVAGFILEAGFLFQTAKGIPRQALATLGKDALTIYDCGVQHLEGVCLSKKIGNQVYSQNGEAQGTIQDIFLDDTGQRIAGFEISDGLFNDLFYGRNAVWQQHVMVNGKDILIVANHLGSIGVPMEEGGQPE